MRKQNFYRNKGYQSCESVKSHVSGKLSIEDLRTSTSKAFLPQKKPQLRLSNQSREISSKIERSTFKKGKVNTMTGLHSTVLSKSNSPLKFSLKNSQLVDQNKLKQYKFYYQIGFGGFGRVWKVQHKGTSKEFAMKEISKHRVLEKHNLESIMNERIILSRLSHPFLINMQRAFQNQSNLYLIMDYLRGGDLRYHICYKENFNDKEIKFIIACIVIGLEYIHSKKIIHKDIKPENIVFEENGYVRITDFGIAQTLPIQKQASMKTQASGTPVYMAPQILFKHDFSYESDYYALGVILFELVIGRRPYQGKSRAEIRKQILQNQINIDQHDLGVGWNPYLADFINKLLIMQPEKRLGRRGIAEVKEHPYFAGIKWKKMERREVKPPFIPNVICQSKFYLDQIAMFDQMNSQKQKDNWITIGKRTNLLFAQYDYDKQIIKKVKEKQNVLKKLPINLKNTKKQVRESQKRLSNC